MSEEEAPKKRKPIEIFAEAEPIKLGSMLLTLVEPHRGHEVAYNRWYERDHFYGGCMIGPWLFAGRRFVATRALKELRLPATSRFAVPVDAGSYLAVYWIHDGYVDEHLLWAGEQVRHLYAEGRGFSERTHAHTGLYGFTSVRYRDPDGVPIALALDHQFAGLAVVVVEPLGRTGSAELIGRLEAGPMQELLSPGSPAANCSSWLVRHSARTRSARVPMALGSDGGSEDRVVQLVFLDDEPTASWDAVRNYVAAVDETGAGRVGFAAPFLPTVVGTDTFSDQLW
jgi:hypothetical protein